MYIKFIGKKNSQYIIYCHSVKSLLIYNIKSDDVIKTKKNTRITIFINKSYNKNLNQNYKWITCFNSNYFINVNVLRNRNIDIIKITNTSANTNAKTISQTISQPVSQPVSQPINQMNMIVSNSNEKIYVYHSKLNLIFSETIHPSVYRTLNIMYTKIKSDFLHDVILQPVLIYFSKLIGHYYDSDQSKNQIKQFIQDYNIDMIVVSKDEINSWKNFNQFFSRKINLDYRPLDLISSNNQSNNLSILCPTDSRVIAFQKNIYMESYIKNSKFNIKQIIPLLDSDKWESLSVGSGFICRLAPQDYHRYHCPLKGMIKEIMICGNKLFSVNPICMKSNYINVLADNMKTILLIHNSELNVNYYMVIIGATFVGSIKFTNNKIQRAYDYLINNNYNKYSFSKPIEIDYGDDIGSFLYGGSTVAVLFDKQLEFDKSIIDFSLYDINDLNDQNNQKNLDHLIESYYYCRSYLAKIKK